MLHAVESCIEITVTIKSSPYPAEQDAKIGNKGSRNASVINDRNKCTNATIPSTLDVPQFTGQSLVAGGTVLGDAACITVGIFPYHGGPKGFEKKNVEVIYVNETFSTEHCCGIIGRANGFGMYDRFCTKKKCYIKAHHKSKFIPNASLFLRLAQMNLHFVAISYTA